MVDLLCNYPPRNNELRSETDYIHPEFEVPSVMCWRFLVYIVYYSLDDLPQVHTMGIYALCYSKAVSYCRHNSAIRLIVYERTGGGSTTEPHLVSRPPSAFQLNEAFQLQRNTQHIQTPAFISIAEWCLHPFMKSNIRPFQPNPFI